MSRKDTHGCRQKKEDLSDEVREWRRDVGREPWAE